MDLEQLVNDYCNIIDGEKNFDKLEADQIFEAICKQLSPLFEKWVTWRIGPKAFSNIGDDILQDAYLGLYKSLSDPNKRWIKGKSKNNRSATFTTWAASFVKFKSKDGCRKEKRHNRNRVVFELAKEKASSGMGPLDIIAYEEFNSKILSQIEQIPDELSKKMLNRSIEGFGGVEIAKEFETNGVRVSRILKKTREYLEKRIF